MKSKIETILFAIICWLGTAIVGLSADTNAPAAKPAVKLTEPQPSVGKVYLDSFLSVRTPDFSTGDYLYGVGVGYQITKHWSIEGRASHFGLDADGNGVQDVGGRVVARLPWAFLAPYTFLGAAFDLERDSWHLEPGAGIELGVSKRLRGLSIFAEGGLDTQLESGSLVEPGWKFSGGVRLRF